MAKVTPPQEIPSELLDGYRAALGEKRPDDGVRKRYPYRVPPMQALVGHPSTKQKAQRAKFNLAIERFNDTPWATRQRWYDAMPPWESFLWYYDYFILSALMYDANIKDGGAGVIKTIQVVKESVPTTGGRSFTISTVDPTKTVVMVYGSSRTVPRVLRGSGSVVPGGSTLPLGDTVDPAKCTVIIQGSAITVPRVLRGSGSVVPGGSTLPLGDTVDPAKCTVKLLGNSYVSDKVQRGDSVVNQNSFVDIGLSPNVDPAISEVKLQGRVGAMSIVEGTGDGEWTAPYVDYLVAATLRVRLITSPLYASCTFSWEVIERLAQTVHPYVSSLSATQIGINWPRTPSAAAVIGWEATEHVEGTVHPYVSSLSATQIGINWPRTPSAAAVIGWEVTEHVEGAVWPVLVSIAAEAVVIDWAEEPDAAADVSIIAIEYI